MECLSDSFDVIAGNRAPIIANPIQNQIALVNALFNYIFPTNAFIDPDGHSLTYTAKLLDDSPLPSWLNFNSLQRKFSGIPNTLTTYPIKVIANDNYGGVISNMFNLIVIDIDDATDATDLNNSTAIISSMIIAACVACIASFSLPLIIGVGIVMLRRHRNKILGNENNAGARKLKEEKELQKLEISNDKKNVVDNELPRLMEEQKKPDKVNEDVELDATPYFRED
jgi:hypothetical protein